MKLSHSASNRYQTCGMSYKLHYLDRLRPRTIGSALVLGSAVDDALNCLLLRKKKDLSESETALIKSTPEQVFLSSFTHFNINGETLDISQSELVDYYKSDCDLNLLDKADQKVILRFASQLDIEVLNWEDFTGFIKQFQSVKEPTDVSEIRLYNYTCHRSLRNKGLMLIEHYDKEIMPKIEEVFSIQDSVSLPDGTDEFIGYVDFTGSFIDEPGVKYVVDNKTSSRPYPKDSVQTSEQLSAYCEYIGTNKAAYIVLEKKIRKRHPQVRSQIIKDTIPEEQFEKTFDNLTEVFHNINEDKFEKDFDACFQYGRKCPYFDLCRGGDTSGLVNLGGKNVKRSN